jgi:SAM-dependent methyltransferase
MKLVNNETLRLIKESESSDTLECEFRFGRYSKSAFDATVDADVFFRVKTHLEKFKLENTVEEIVEKIYKSAEKKASIKSRTNVATNKTVVIEKTVLKTVELYSYGIRAALSKEVETTPDLNSVPVSTRTKIRYSFVDSSKALRYDLTKVTEDGSGVTRFYIELELLKSVTVALVEQRLNLILQIIQDSFYIVTQERIDQIKGWYADLTRTPYFIGAQPEGLTMGNMKMLNKSSYSVTVKADGQRYFLFVYKGQVVLLDNNIQNVKETFITLKNSDTLIGNCLLDVELVPSMGKFTCFVFDILFYNGADLRGNRDYTLKERMKLVDKIVVTLGKYSKQYIFESKKYFFNNLSLGCKIIQETNYEFKTDGMIFTPINEPYPIKRKWPGLLKWKDQYNSTIDFYSVQDDKNPRLWKLYVQGSEESKVNKKVLFDTSKLMNDTTRPRSFETEFDPNEYDKTTGERFLSNTVIEYRFDKVKDSFVPMRTRWDKTRNPNKHGNHYTVACDIWRYIQNPIEYSQLLKLYTPRVKYNPAEQDPHFKVMRQFHNDIKRETYNKYTRNTDTLLELCCGRGGDLPKWSYNNVKHVDAYDISEESLEIAKNRYATLKKTNPKCGVFNFYKCDLVTDYNRITKKYDNIVCHFGLHYLYRDAIQFKQLLVHLKSILKQDGRLIVTIVDDTVLEGKPEEYYTSEREIISYYKYNSGEKALSVFTSGNNYLSFNTSETVLNKSDLIRNAPFELESSKSFVEAIEESKIQLSKHEYSISKLYSILVFKNTRELVEIQTPADGTCPVYTPSKDCIAPIIEMSPQIQLIKIKDLYELYDYVNMNEIVYNKYTQSNSELNCSLIKQALSKHNVMYIQMDDTEISQVSDAPLKTVVISKTARQVVKQETYMVDIYYLTVYKDKTLFTPEEAQELLGLITKHTPQLDNTTPEPEPTSEPVESTVPEPEPREQTPPSEPNDDYKNSLSKMTVKELKLVLKELNQSVTGTKSVMIDRILEAKKVKNV